MFTLKRSTTATLLTAVLGLTSFIAPIALSSDTQAQRLPRISRGSIPAGTTLPTDAVDAETEKILLAPAEEEPLPLVLELSANVRDSEGRILIPAGTLIEGYVEVVEEEGARFVAEEILIGSDRLVLSAQSEFVTETETVKKGSDGDDILEGAAIGAGAATVIAILTGDNSVSIGEILLGGGLGALGGLILGGKNVELYSIDPNEDLDVTLTEALAL